MTTLRDKVHEIADNWMIPRLSALAVARLVAEQNAKACAQKGIRANGHDCAAAIRKELEGVEMTTEPKGLTDAWGKYCVSVNAPNGRPHDEFLAFAKGYAAGAVSVPRYKQVAWRQAIDNEALNISHIYRDSMPMFSEKWEPVYVIDAAREGK